MPSLKRKSRDLRTEVLESASSSLRAAAQNKRARLSESAGPSEDSRSRGNSFFSEADFASTQFQPSSINRQTYEDARDDITEVDSDEDAERIDEATKSYVAEKEEHANVANQAAECGILQSVTCQNFMCHRKLHVDFGALINFIIGHNGSGKSAVLTAITLGLGGKPTATNRGSSLRAFVREGADAALLTVKIKNQGIAAYKRDLYGDTIIVERHFNAQGTSGFKLKSKDGRIITTKKAELDEINDFFALQLDNPVNVLTQDQARQFLNNSSHAEKYRFFMKGVQLEQLDNDYSILGEQLDNADQALISVKEDCEVLKEKYEAAKKKLELSLKSENVRDRIRKYSRQMAWAQVEEQERLLEELEQGVEQQKQRVQAADENFQNKSAQFEQADQVVQEAEREVGDLKQDKQPLDQSHLEAKEKFDAVRQEIQDAQHTEREIKGNLDSERKRMQESEQAIEGEYQRLSDRSDGRENDKRQEIRDTEESLQSIQEQGRGHDAAYAQLEDEKKAIEDHYKRADFDEKKKRSAVQDGQKQLAGLQNQQRDKFDAFNKSYRQAVRAIDQDSGFSSKPVGPLAFHVRNKLPQWQNIIEKTFGNLLDNFIVTSRQDQRRLSDLLKKHSCNANVLVADPNFWINALNEPDEHFLTILRALEIDNELVRNQLVINSAIEQTILVDTQNEAIKLSEHRMPDHCKAIMCPHPRERGRGFRYTQGRGGSQKMEPVSPWTRPLRMKTDDQAAIRSQQDTVQALKDELHQAEQQKSRCAEAAKAASQAIHQHKRRSKDLQLQAQQTEDKIAQLRSDLEEMQPQDGALDGLKQQFEDHKEQVEHLKQQLDTARKEKEDVAYQNREHKRELDKLSAQLEQKDAAIAAAEKKIDKYKATRMRALTEKNEADHQRVDREQDVQRAETERDDQKNNLDYYFGEASKVCTRVPIEDGRTWQWLEEKIEKLHNERDRHDALVGGDKETVQIQHLEAKRKLIDAEKSFKATQDLKRSLSLTLQDRTAVWRHFRQNITMRARTMFRFLMHQRGFRGDMRVNHQHKQLVLDVSPDARRNGGAGGQTKTLSGGEKSFSTVCMLLSLWEAMGSPIRCLDEFDVFMDSVNRDMSMRMMIESARQAVGRQFILITPQAMGGVEYGNDVKIVRLNDPERGQTTLNIPGA